MNTESQEAPLENGLKRALAGKGGHAEPMFAKPGPPNGQKTGDPEASDTKGNDPQDNNPKDNNPEQPFLRVVQSANRTKRLGPPADPRQRPVTGRSSLVGSCIAMMRRRALRVFGSPPPRHAEGRSPSFQSLTPPTTLLPSPSALTLKARERWRRFVAPTGQQVEHNNHKPGSPIRTGAIARCS